MRPWPFLWSAALFVLTASLAPPVAGQDLPSWGDNPEWGDAASQPPSAEPAPSWEEGADSPGPAAETLSAPRIFAPAPSELDLDSRLDTLDRQLKEVQAGTRGYFYSWMAIQAGLFVGQGIYALRSDDPVIRTSYFIGTGVSAISMGIFLIQKWPGRTAYKRYQAMSAGTERERREKLAAGEEDLTAQAAADTRAVSWLRHALGIGAALGSAGVIVLMHEHSLKEAVRRTFATFLISELQILTRPRKARRYAAGDAGASREPQFSFAPWFHHRAQGLSLHAAF